MSTLVILLLMIVTTGSSVLPSHDAPRAEADVRSRLRTLLTALQNAESIDQIASTTLPLCRDTSSASSLEGGGGAGAALDTLEALQDIVVKLRARHVSVQDILNAVSESLNKRTSDTVFQPELHQPSFPVPHSSSSSGGFQAPAIHPPTKGNPRPFIQPPFQQRPSQPEDITSDSSPSVLNEQLGTNDPSQPNIQDGSQSNHTSKLTNSENSTLKFRDLGTDGSAASKFLKSLDTEFSSQDFDKSATPFDSTGLSPSFEDVGSLFNSEYAKYLTGEGSEVSPPKFEDADLPFDTEDSEFPIPWNSDLQDTRSPLRTTESKFSPSRYQDVGSLFESENSKFLTHPPSEFPSTEFVDVELPFDLDGSKFPAPLEIVYSHPELDESRPITHDSVPPFNSATARSPKFPTQPVLDRKEKSFSDILQELYQKETKNHWQDGTVQVPIFQEPSYLHKNITKETGSPEEYNDKGEEANEGISEQSDFIDRQDTDTKQTDMSTDQKDTSTEETASTETQKEQPHINAKQSKFQLEPTDSSLEHSIVANEQRQKMKQTDFPETTGGAREHTSSDISHGISQSRPDVSSLKHPTHPAETFEETVIHPEDPEQPTFYVRLAKQQKDDRRQSKSDSFPHIGVVAPPRGVRVMVRDGSSLMWSTEITLQPAMSVYKAIYEAEANSQLLSSSSSPTSPLHVGVGPSAECNIITTVNGHLTNQHSQWIIQVTDQQHKEIYNSACIPLSQHLTLKSGYTISLTYSTRHRR